MQRKLTESLKKDIGLSRDILELQEDTVHLPRIIKYYKKNHSHSLSSYVLRVSEFITMSGDHGQRKLKHPEGSVRGSWTSNQM